METAETGWERGKIMELDIARVVIQFPAVWNLSLPAFGEETLPLSEDVDRTVQLGYDAKRAYDAAYLGIDPAELRQKVAVGASTGHLVVEKGTYQHISLARLIKQLDGLGFYLIDAHWCERYRHKGPKIYMTFSPEGKKKDLGLLAVFLESTWNDLVIFANPNFIKGNKIIRSDSILLFGRHEITPAAWQLELDGTNRGYTLEEICL